jgi:hypothetical protein
MAKIHLIGTVHSDLEGERRLEKALKEEEPEIVTLEAGEGFLDYLAQAEEKNERLFRRMQIKGCDQGHIENVRKLISAYGFEYRSCKNYCEERGIPLHLIDDGKIYPWMSNFLNGKKTIKIPKRNILEKTRKDNDSWYKVFQAIFEGKLSGGGVSKVYSNGLISYKVLGERDQFMAGRVRNLASKCDGKIVHVGGAFHLLNSNITLYSRIQEYNPSRTALGAYDESFQRMGPVSLMCWGALDAFFKKFIKE